MTAEPTAIQAKAFELPGLPPQSRVYSNLTA